MGALLGILTLLTIGLVFLVVPPAEGLGYYVRLAFLHIPVAWVAVLAFLISAYEGARFLRSGELAADAKSAAAAQLGFIFVILATVSGAVFSKLTWGAYWNWDPRQTTIFVLLLIYGAYLTLRGAMPAGRRRAKVAAVYALFSFLTVPFIFFPAPIAGAEWLGAGYGYHHAGRAYGCFGRCDGDFLLAVPVADETAAG